MSISHQKVKSVAKVMIPRGQVLQDLIHETLKTCSDLVGSTLGPGGMSVVIERQETGLPPVVTKDGVTVYKALGFNNPVQQVLMETAREASIRTAAEAGDGPQPLWSKVLTPNGFVEMRDVTVGMEICGTNGTTQTVVGIFPKGVKEIVKVTFEQGQVVECCEDHLWSVAVGHGARYAFESTATAKTLLKDFKPGLYVTPGLNGNFTGPRIVNIEYTGRLTEMQCIKVSNPDSLYITDDFIVTHNTTTATILSEALVSNISKVTKKYPNLSPQSITRALDKMFNDVIEPTLKTWSLPCDLSENKKRCWDVARISANGDKALADAVMQCYDIVGDLGNVTITEASGRSEYEVKQIEGFPIAMGYEDSCGTFWPEFVNDKATQQAVLSKPLWILYNGVIRDFNDIFVIAQNVAEAASEGRCSPSIVVTATGFSETFIATCAASFQTKGAVRIFPLMAPRSIQKTAQQDFLHDLAALTGARVFDPLTAPLESIEGLSDLGGRSSGPTSFECGRFRSLVVGRADDEILLNRVDELVRQMDNQGGGEYDKNVMNERIAKLTSGIARLTVRGSSNGEVKEKRDRAEDAVCAVRSAIKFGALAGGGTTWMKLVKHLPTTVQSGNVNQILVDEIFIPSLKSVVERLFLNAGFVEAVIPTYIEGIGEGKAFDLQTGEWNDPAEMGLLDSFSAVRDSLKNAISVSTSLGTCGGAIVFTRDAELERREAVESMEYLKAANYNEANNRG